MHFLRSSIFLLLIVVGFASLAAAAEESPDRAHWSLEIKGGRFTPKIEGFSNYYGKSTLPEYAGSLAYKLLPQLEIGAGAGGMKIKGQSFYRLHNSGAGSATYELFPIKVFVTLRGVFFEDQLVVPYVGGGWTRMYYQQKIQNQDTVRGFADGYHARAGLQFALNSLDTGAATRMYNDYGVLQTYFFVEAELSRAKESNTSIELGGTALLGGLLFEF